MSTFCLPSITVWLEEKIFTHETIRGQYKTINNCSLYYKYVGLYEEEEGEWYRADGWKEDLQQGSYNSGSQTHDPWPEPVPGPPFIQPQGTEKNINHKAKSIPFNNIFFSVMIIGFFHFMKEQKIVNFY